MYNGCTTAQDIKCATFSFDTAPFIRAAMAYRACDPGVVCHNEGGWHSSRQAHLLPELRELMHELASLWHWPVFNAWFNANAVGHGNVPHHHGGYERSGVYFVQGTVGDLLFPTVDRRISPRPNLAVTFPASLLHAVETNTSDVERLSIGFNFSHAGKEHRRQRY